MHPKNIKPRKALNKAFLKVKVTREAMEGFKGHLVTLLDRMNLEESEEHAKNHIRTFLEDAFYKDTHHINTKDRIDLVIHAQKSPKSPVSVLIEAKKPGKNAEMFAADDPAAKSMCELVLYYLRERIDENNQDLRNMVITNGHDWYLFDAADFDRVFFAKAKLKNDYIDWKEGRKTGTKTDYFYDHIAKPFLINAEDEFPFVHLDLRKYEKAARNDDPTDDKSLIVLYKLLSPSHLLKEPFANDSNSLNKDFYAELLHIIGLEETKEKNKKVIQRYEKGKRLDGSLLENIIERLEVNDSLGSINNIRDFGSTKEEQYFSVGLELAITWINRILFLKLLEAQLQSYHRGDKSYKFLAPNEIRDFDELFNLFFMVLACKPSERKTKVQERYAKVPYLNSSLFEQNDLERKAFSINQIDNFIELPIHSRTVLRDDKNKRLTGKMNTLEYLLRFLDAYDFSSEGGEEIQEENKTLINASVLGLIFEKINGYRDGSFFTPGFVTMYMCRETLRRAVVQKFNTAFGWKAQDFKQLKEQLEIGAEARKQYNDLLNTLRICDPAVGSGHFLVSALNELLAIKSDLGILAYGDGARIKEYGLKVENDELVITDYEEDRLFQYTIGNGGKPLPQLQKLQEALFHEKQTLIENCLFGVDINPNSVKICRLRLWIELLKNAYYTTESSFSDLETLPNIDINIKQGNSLISRFQLDEDLKDALKQSGHSVKEYRAAVQDYHHAVGREEKAKVMEIIDGVKGAFRDTIDKPLMRKIASARGIFATREEEISNLKAFGQKISAKLKKDLAKAKAAFEKAVLERKEIEENVIYRDAFEWRFEFPEVLDDEGGFVGFDVVIGNPPYGVNFEESGKVYIRENYASFKYRYESYFYFIELAPRISMQSGFLSMITPTLWLNLENGVNLRKILLEENSLLEVKIFGDGVFEDAVVPTCSFIARQGQPSVEIVVESSAGTWEVYFDEIKLDPLFAIEYQTAPHLMKIIKKIIDNSKSLETFGEVIQGITPYDSYKGHSKEQIKTRAFHAKENGGTTFGKWLYGKDITRYSLNWSGEWLNYGEWLAAPRLPTFFEGTRILFREVPGKGKRIQAHLVDEVYYYGHSISPLKVFDEFAFLAETLLGIVNSKLVSFYAGIRSPNFGKDVFPKLNPKDIKELPIPLSIMTLKKGNKVDVIVKKLMSAHRENFADEIESLESEIDQLVYELYGLNEDEIAIVEGLG